MFSSFLFESITDGLKMVSLNENHAVYFIYASERKNKMRAKHQIQNHFSQTV